MDVVGPAFYDFWIHLFSRTTYDDRDAARVSATSRVFREILRRHGLIRVFAPLGTCRNPDHGYRTFDEFERWYRANAGMRLDDASDCFACKGALTSVAHPRTSAVIDMAHDRHGLAAAVVGMSHISAVGNSCVADVMVIPRSATALRFGDNFNERVFVSDLPYGLRDLAFGARFNRSFDEGRLPPELTSLELGASFDHWMCFANLPRGLKTLSFGARYDKPLDVASLPPTLERLTVPRDTLRPEDLDLLQMRGTTVILL